MLVKPICVKCQCFYRPKHNGHYFTEMKPDNNRNGLYPDEYRGTRHPEVWSPYKLWCGDLWECPDCFHELVVGVCGGPVSEHYKPEFEGMVVRTNGDQLKVNDC